jgi:dihydroxyacetone kinase
MSGRVSRQRAPVDYNNKESMVPAWLKGIQSTKSQTPPKKASKKVISSPGSAEKENGVVEKKAISKPKASKSSKGSEKETVAPVAEKKIKQKKSSTIGEKAAAQPARGRNAGLTVVPIGEFDR